MIVKASVETGAFFMQAIIINMCLQIAYKHF